MVLARAATARSHQPRQGEVLRNSTFSEESPSPSTAGASRRVFKLGRHPPDRFLCDLRHTNVALSGTRYLIDSAWSAGSTDREA